MPRKIIPVFFICLHLFPQLFAQSNGDYYRRYLLNRAYVDSASKDFDKGLYLSSAKKFLYARKLCPFYKPDGCEYYIACCFVNLKKFDQAVYYLRKCTHADWVLDAIKTDTLLTDLRNNPKAMNELSDYFIELGKDTGSNTSLKKQLMGMMDGDQKLRFKMEELDTMRNIDSATYQTMQHALWDVQNKIDDSDIKVLKQIVSIYGWPTYSMVGKVASKDAWLILQHCSQKDSFQKTCLPLIEKAVRNNQVSEHDLAYLKDRMLMYKGEKQIYGTQYMVTDPGKVNLYQVDNEEELDARREKIGLEPIGTTEKVNFKMTYQYKN